jgi:hypothetical protein
MTTTTKERANFNRQTQCGHPGYYAKELCRNCYEQQLRQINSDYATRQRENCSQWSRKNKYRKSLIDKQYKQKLKKEDPLYNRRKTLKNYGLTITDYDEMLQRQDNRCAICHKPAVEEHRALAVDHNATTGQIRGLLCFRCNFGLGWFQEDRERLIRAVKHLADNNLYEKGKGPIKKRKPHTGDIHVGFQEPKRVDY